MIFKILVTGVQYYCKDSEALRLLLIHLLNDKPTVYLVMKVTQDYGVVIEVKEGRTVIGVVSRFDVDDVVGLMSRTGFNAFEGKICSVSIEGGYFFVDTEESMEEYLDGESLEDVLSEISLKRRKDSQWDAYNGIGTTVMRDSKDEEETASAVNFLDMAFRKKGKKNDLLMMEYLKGLIVSTRFDVSMETQAALKKILNHVETSDNLLIHSFIDELVHAINDIGSRQRQEEMGEEFERMIHSEEADELLNNWYSKNVHSAMDGEDLRELMRQQLERIDENLQTLPANLYYNRDYKGLLMHRALYTGIPHMKLKMLQSDLILREYLMDELELVKEFQGGEEVTEEDCQATVMQERTDDVKETAIISAINIMAKNGKFRYKKDFACILRMIRDMEVFEKITIESFVRMTDKCDLEKRLRPNKSNITSLTIGRAKHPNWKIAGADVKETKRLVDLGEEFKRLYNNSH